MQKCFCRLRTNKNYLQIFFTTNAGGSSEIVEDNVDGFIARAPTAEAFDEALERAWSRRHEWEQIGRRAAESIKKIVPFDPAAQFAKMLLQIADE